jgi:hypothetical protein
VVGVVGWFFLVVYHFFTAAVAVPMASRLRGFLVEELPCVEEREGGVNGWV